MSDTDDTSTVAGTETPAPAPQPVEPQQTESSPRGRRWFNGGWRWGIIAAVVVVVAGAFFTIGWFTSTRGDHGRYTAKNGIHQMMNTGERGRLQGETDQRGTDQWQTYPNRGRGMIVPQQGQTDRRRARLRPRGRARPPQGQTTQQGYLGVGVATVTPQLQQQFGLSGSNGVLVASIDRSGPAFKAGVQQGDLITSINGTPVTQAEAVVSLIAQMKTGDTVSLVIDRNGQSLTLQVTLAAKAASITG